MPITKDTSLKVTIARWITPNGTNLSAGGLDPDVKVDITKEDVEKGRDPQLDKAIELLHKGVFPKGTATSSNTVIASSSVSTN